MHYIIIELYLNWDTYKNKYIYIYKYIYAFVYEEKVLCLGLQINVQHMKIIIVVIRLYIADFVAQLFQSVSAIQMCYNVDICVFVKEFNRVIVTSCMGPNPNILLIG